MTWPFTTTGTTSTATRATALRNPLNLPEIRLLIALYLDRASLLACCQVNRAFLSSFHYVLTWASVTLERCTREDFPLWLIQQNEHLIRRLVLEDTQVFIDGWKFLHCRNLKVLDLCVDSRRFDDDHGRHPAIREVGAQMLQLVRQNLGLKELRINWEPMSLQHRQILNRNLDDVYSYSIVKLTLFEATCDAYLINALIEHCPRMEELEIEGYYLTPPGGLQVELELRQVRKLTMARVACRHGHVLFLGPEVRELRLRYFLHHTLVGPSWGLPKLESLYCENLEGAVANRVIGQWNVNQPRKVELRKMRDLRETLTCLVERSEGAIRELTVDRDSMWTLSFAERREFLRQMPQLEKLNEYHPRLWASSAQSCTIS
ncbi:hypothetical protein BGX30_004363 [Mortierella sp. GBA39]|nr:hypothetical protein BGX30_004363 [Mortierella sp. GBA39]